MGACGPSGRAIAEAIDTDLLSAIQAHLNMERQAHASYFAAAIWFAERELRGFSRFFREESNSEHEHAAKFAEYIIARGQSVALQVVDAPLQNWAYPADVIATAVFNGRESERYAYHGVSRPDGGNANPIRTRICAPSWTGKVCRKPSSGIIAHRQRARPRK